jgi:hypothetical protein
MHFRCRWGNPAAAAFSGTFLQITASGFCLLAALFPSGIRGFFAARSFGV